MAPHGDDPHAPSRVLPLNSPLTSKCLWFGVHGLRAQVGKSSPGISSDLQGWAAHMRRVPRSVAGEGLRALMRARTRPGVTLGPHLLLTHPRAGGTQRGATSPFDGSPSHAPPASCSPSEMPGCPPAPTIPAGNPEGLSEVCTLWPCSRRSWGPLCSP